MVLYEPELTVDDIKLLGQYGCRKGSALSDDNIPSVEFRLGELHGRLISVEGAQKAEYANRSLRDKEVDLKFEGVATEMKKLGDTFSSSLKDVVTNVKAITDDQTKQLQPLINAQLVQDTLAFQGTQRIQSRAARWGAYFAIFSITIGGLTFVNTAGPFILHAFLPGSFIPHQAILHDPTSSLPATN
ncbi:MAG: hypothetical protein P4N59_11470 [Negativicutes bacterium]|nr:hypothetical protein [Negativicutes bacterium]